MNYQTIDRACGKLLKLLTRLSQEKQSQIIEEIQWEIQQTDLLIETIRTDRQSNELLPRPVSSPQEYRQNERSLSNERYDSISNGPKKKLLSQTLP